MDAHENLARHLREIDVWTEAAVYQVLENCFRDLPAAEPLPARVSSGRNLFVGHTHIGYTFRSFATLAGESEQALQLLDFDEIACALMALDWEIQGLSVRLRTLERLQIPEKSGLDWLTGRDEELPRGRTLGDTAQLLVLRAAAAYFDWRDHNLLRKLKGASRDRERADAVVTLYRLGAMRAAKIGYFVPRLVLLREVAYESGDLGLAVEAAKRSVEIALKYREAATDHAAVAQCNRVALSFLTAAMKLGPDAGRSVANEVAYVLRSALFDGCSASSLWPFPLSLTASTPALAPGAR